MINFRINAVLQAFKTLGIGVLNLRKLKYLPKPAQVIPPTERRNLPVNRTILTWLLPSFRI
jgi:hypothetical protein